jgi:two-component system, sensor histidine kinase PdtaS
MAFLTPDSSFYPGYLDKGKYLLTWRLTLLFVLIFFLLATTFAFINLYAFAFYAAVFTIGLVGFIYLHTTKKYVPIFWTFTTSATVLVFLSLNLVMEIVHYAEFFWIAAIVIFAFIGLSRRAGIFFLVVNALSVSVHMLLRLNLNIAFQDEHTTMEIAGILTEILFALFTIGYLLHQYLLFQSYAENQLKLANEELAAQNQIIVKKNEENSMLAKEIHHRVKNNLQIVISLLRMHSDEVKSEETKRHFSEATNRIMTMSLIHQKLYQEKELSNIDFDAYLEDLAQEIIGSSRNGHRRIACRIDSEVKRVGLKTIVPLGLLLNELMTNSLKHAFADRIDGEISIRVAELSQGTLELEYSDDGSWKGCAATATDGFGFELIGLLTGQLEGTFERVESRYRFELSNLDH